MLRSAQERLPGFGRTSWVAFLGGAFIGVLGGLIGLGGAEFRLPLLIGIFGFVALEAIILNKATSLIVVASALVFRSQAVPVSAIFGHASIVATLLAGSLFGAWYGADLATRLNSQSLYRIIAVLLVGIAIVLLAAHNPTASTQPLLTGTLQTLAGIGAGFVIGVIAAFLGVAHPRFVLAMALGSVAGTFIGGLLLGVVPAALLLPVLATILVLSAVKLWWHR